MAQPRGGGGGEQRSCRKETSLKPERSRKPLEFRWTMQHIVHNVMAILE
jgi:hypothetical protein